jgi:hypothetical protein
MLSLLVGPRVPEDADSKKQAPKHTEHDGSYDLFTLPEPPPDRYDAVQ